MALVREVGSARFYTGAVTLTPANPSAQIVGSDEERRGVVIYPDPAATVAVYLADTAQHAAQGAAGRWASGALIPAGLGFALGTTAPVYVFILAATAPAAGVNVYAVAEAGANPDHWQP